MEDKQRRKSADSGTYRIRPAHVSTKGIGNGMPVGHSSTRNSNVTSRNGPISVGEDRLHNMQSGRDSRNGVRTLDGSACSNRANDISKVTKTVKTVKSSGGSPKAGGAAGSAVWQAGGHSVSQDRSSSRPATPKHMSNQITTVNTVKKEKRTRSPSSVSTGSEDTFQRNTRTSSSLRKKSSRDTGRPSPESTPVAGRSSPSSRTRVQKSSGEYSGQMNKSGKTSPKRSGTGSRSTLTKRPSIQRTLSGSLPAGSSATIGHCKAASATPQITVIKKSKSVGNIASAGGRRTPSSTPSGTPKRNPGGVKTICVEITMERRKSLDRNSLSSNASGGERPRSASRQSSRTSANSENIAPTKAKQKTDSLERSRVSSAPVNSSRTDRNIAATNGAAVRPKSSSVMQNSSPKSERIMMNGSTGTLRNDYSTQRRVQRARSVDPSVRIVKTMSMREASPSPKLVHNGARVKRSQSMERHNSRDSNDSYVSKQKQAWEEKSSTTVITTVTEITRVHKRVKEQKAPASNRKSALISQRHEMFVKDKEDTYPPISPTKSPTKSPSKIPTRSPNRSPTGSPNRSPTRSPTKSPIKSAMSKSPTKSAPRSNMEYATLPSKSVLRAKAESATPTKSALRAAAESSTPPSKSVPKPPRGAAVESSTPPFKSAPRATVESSTPPTNLRSAQRAKVDSPTPPTNLRSAPRATVESPTPPTNLRSASRATVESPIPPLKSALKATLELSTPASKPPPKPMRSPNTVLTTKVDTHQPPPPPPCPPPASPLAPPHGMISPQRALSPERVRSPEKPKLPEKPAHLTQSFKARLAKERANQQTHRSSTGNQSDDESYSKSSVVAKRDTTGKPSARPQSCYELTSKAKPPKPPPPPRRDLPKHEQSRTALGTIPATGKQNQYPDVPFIDETEDDVFKMADLHIQEDGKVREATTARPTVLQENVLKYRTQSNTNIISRYDEVDSALNTSPTKENDVFHLSERSTPLIDPNSQEKWALNNKELLNSGAPARKTQIVDNKELNDRTSDFNSEKKSLEVTNNNLGDKCVEEVDKNGHYYLKVVNLEHARIEGLCQAIERDIQDDIPEDASGKVRAAIGKATLLTSKKFKQFRGLCEQNLTQSGDEAFCTTSTDLAGFWDMVMLQVEDVTHMLAELDKLKQNGWKSPVIVRAKHRQLAAGLEIMACMSSLLLPSFTTDSIGYKDVARTDVQSGDVSTGEWLSEDEARRLSLGSGRKRTTSSSTSTTPPPSPSPISVTKPLKWSAAPPQPDPKAKAEREAKAIKARKSREEARRRLMAAKRAARQRVKSVDKQEDEAVVEIFVPETS